MNEKVLIDSMDKSGVFHRIKEGINWRLQKYRDWIRWRHYRSILWQTLGEKETQWARVVMDRTTEEFVSTLDVSSLAALEISGEKWKDAGFGSYQSVGFPEHDICERPFKTEAFDVIIAEQVLEHVLWPFRAARNVYQMLRRGGIFIVTTPFLLKVHNYPVDCSRWTELGLKHLLAEAGFKFAQIQTGSWGNRSCVRGNFVTWKHWVPWLHSLRNEPDFPVVVWGFAKKEPT